MFTYETYAQVCKKRNKDENLHEYILAQSYNAINFDVKANYH